MSLEEETNSGTLENQTFEYDGEIYKLYTGEESINNRLFTGREFDKETRFYYYRARYYSVELGRFISRDPIGINDDINLYTYVGNNPINYTDPSGEVAKETRNGLDESTRVRIDGTGRVLVGGLETVGGGAVLVGGAGLCTTGIGCVGGAVGVVYGANYLVAGSTEMGGGFAQIWSGERNDVYFNAGHKIIEATIEDKTTQEYTKLGLDVADLGVGAVKVIKKAPELYKGGKKIVGKVIEEAPKFYNKGVEIAGNLKNDFKTGVEIVKSGNFPTLKPQLAGISNDVTNVVAKKTDDIEETGMKLFGFGGGKSKLKGIPKGKLLMDYETVLSDGNRFINTGIKWETSGGKSIIYIDKKTKNFVYRDFQHTGPENHLEVFSSDGKHLGGYNPFNISQKVKPGNEYKIDEQIKYIKNLYPNIYN